MDTSTFRYYELKIAAKRLPGRMLRIDPIAVVFSKDGSSSEWTELGRTEKRLNEWNPKFSNPIVLPADNDNQRRVDLRVDFYNKEVKDGRFLGAAEVNIFSLIFAKGQPVELELKTPDATKGSPRVFLTALEGFRTESEPSSVKLSFQLMQTNFYGVSMRVFYEISRAGEGLWHPVFKSSHILLDQQGWGQFPTHEISMRDLTMDVESQGILISLYRYRRIGTRKLLGHFQTSVKELTRTSAGDFIPFSANPNEDILSADVQVLHTQKNGLLYEFGLKLINVQWNATNLLENRVK
ncbi:unnamed protein product [Agarophyton chilense]